MYTNTLTSISGDDLLVMPSYGNNLILEVSANNDIFFKKGNITKGFGNIVSNYLDVSFVREASFNSLNSQMQYVLQEISGISNDLLDTSYNIILSGGVFIQNNEYASYDILDITGKIIFTDNSTNVQRINDISLNNVDICGSLNVAGSISASNIYTKTEIDASLANVYTKNLVYNKSEIDASLANVYTKNLVYNKSEIDASLANVYTKNLVYTKSEVDASLVNVYTKNLVYTKSEVDNSFTNVYTKNLVYNKSEIDASLVNVYTKNQVYTKTEIDASLSNVYTKNQVYNKSEIDVSLANVYTKNQVYSKTEIDASFTNVYSKLYMLDSSLANVYTRGQIDVSFVSKKLFDASLANVYTKNLVYNKSEIDASLVNVYTKNQVYTKSEVDNSFTNVYTKNQVYSKTEIDVSLANVYTKNQVYNKTEIDASLANVYTKNQIYNKTEIDASFSNVYTRGQIDVSFVSKQLFDASLSSIQVSNVYTKSQIDVSFVSKQLFETSYNVLLSSIGTGGGSGSGSGGGGGTTTTTSSIAKKFYNQDWNLLGTNITKVKDVSGNSPSILSASLDGYSILVYWPSSSIFYPTGVGSQEQPRTSIAVYTFISNSWVQKGETILLPFTYVPSWRYAESGGAGGDQTGLATDFNISGKFMSGDGNTIAIPISRAGYGENTGEYLNNIYTDVVYSFNGTAWIEIASVTSQNSNRAGNAFFTFENNVIKRFLIGVGGSLTNVIIHTLTDGSFVQDSAQISESEVNTSINVPGSLDFWSRRARSISADGKVVLFCKQNSMVLFKYNGTIWQQYGNVTLITLPTWSTTTGKLSNDGSVFLVGSWDSTVNGDTYAGRSKIYAYDSSSNTWIQRGQDIVYEEVQYIDEAQGIQFGSDTKLLSGDGLTVAFGGRNRPSVIYNNDGGSNYYSGYLQAYRYSSVNNYWSKIGREITGVTMERPGQYIASSYNGNVIHIDGQSFKETFTSVDTGRIRVYEIEVDPSFSSLSSGSSGSSSVDAYSKIEIDASFSNVYTKSQIDVSFVSKQLFDASINALAANSGSGNSVLKFSNNLWNKLGFDISGSGNDNLGSKIALSDDGTTIAVAVPNDDTSGTDFGAVIIYKYINYNWQQLGNKIAVSPAATNGSYASELAISGNGTIIAFLYNYDIYEDINYGGTIYNELVGYSVVKSFSYNNTLWNETGSVSIASKNYNGNSYSPYTSMSFSRDGSTLAMGRWGADANRGETYVYKFIDSSWNKYGPTIIPPFTGLAAGFKVSLSSNGNIIAVGNWDGSSWPNTTLSRAGSVIVYSYYSNTWNIMGEIIRGKKSYDQGHYIKLSGDGQILAIGAYGVDNYDNGLDSGAAYIYKYNTTDNSWNQLGQTIIPFAELHFEENTYTYFGASIALSVDGNTIAITQQGYDGEIFTSQNAGRCIVYKYINNYWSQYGQYIPGFEYEGSSDIALSSDGATLAYSSQNFKNGIGRVRVFGINNVSSSSSSSSSSLTSDVASLLASLTSRIAMLEATAIIRSFDTIVGPVNSFNIPIDLSNNESLQIDMSVKITGEEAYKVFLKYNTESSTANLWRYYNGRFVYGEYGDTFALWGEDMLSENNGLLVEGPNTNETIIIRIEVFRSYDRASPTQKFWYKASTLFHWSDLGLSRIDCQGETSELSSLIPTALYFNIAPQAQSTTNSSNSFMNVSYSIIKDMRRTALGGPIL
jgi:hypothetical protein